jgi:hypothetical protein
MIEWFRWFLVNNADLWTSLIVVCSIGEMSRSILHIPWIGSIDSIRVHRMTMNYSSGMWSRHLFPQFWWCTKILVDISFKSRTTAKFDIILHDCVNRLSSVGMFRHFIADAKMNRRMKQDPPLTIVPNPPVKTKERRKKSKNESNTVLAD